MFVNNGHAFFSGKNGTITRNFGNNMNDTKPA